MDEVTSSPYSGILKYIAVSAAVVFTLIFALLIYLNHEEPTGGDFSLTYRGEPWKFSDQPKDLNAFYIGYAKCPDVCPLTLSFAGQAFRRLSESELDKVRLLFLSVDFENDNPEDVAEYAAQFYPTFLGLSGSEDDVRQAVSLFRTSFFLEKDFTSHLGYTIAHPDRIFFLNNKGIVVDSISGPMSAEMILKTIQENL